MVKHTHQARERQSILIHTEHEEGELIDEALSEHGSMKSEHVDQSMDIWM